MAFASTFALPSDQDGTLQAILQTLLLISSKLPGTDPVTTRERVLIEAVTATNISTNAAQWAGTAGVSGVGASAAGAPRVTPSNDTMAGLPTGGITNGTTMTMDASRAGLQSIYANIVTQ